MSHGKRVRKARMRARRARLFARSMARATSMLVELEERARFRRELAASDLPDSVKTVLGFLADPVGAVVDEATKFAWAEFCELCIDPIDEPHVDQDGTKRWRPCPNPATREVLADNGKPLRVCEEHFRKEAS